LDKFTVFSVCETPFRYFGLVARVLRGKGYIIVKFTKTDLENLNKQARKENTLSMFEAIATEG